ncbi:MAG: hypothetical protein LBK71_01650 [Verrucomicrobiales bacterium]|jgi:hypothetical protein|nr:hypothetical protein [Verrucomicrobiales bacterium]
MQNAKFKTARQKAKFARGAGMSGVDYTGIDVNTIKGYRLIGYGWYPTEFVANPVVSGSMLLGRQTTRGHTYWPYSGTSKWIQPH